MKVYFGNLPKDIDDAKLGELVKPFGTPTSSEVVNDRVTGQSKGFAFVEFANDEEARATIKGLDGKDVNGQAVVVNEARSRKDAPKPVPAVQH
ncbi:MAG: RNA-binding protein [Acidobacteriota bacterium]|nr:RNA-binding protein [Acidobacteriota bacterium]